MDLDDTARVLRPRDAVEYRLGTVTDITHAPHSTDSRRVRLRFPTGDERTYTTDEITGCSREDDHAALVAALTSACRSLRDACRVANDYDEALSTDIVCLAMAILDIARDRLNAELDLDSADPARDAHADRGQP